MAINSAEPLGFAQLLKTYLGPQSGRVAILAGLLFTGVGLQLIGPQILKRFVDSAIPGPAVLPMATLWALAGLYIAVALLIEAAQVATTWFSEQVGWTATNRLRHDLAAHALGHDLIFQNAKTPGELIERIDGDVTALATFFSQFVLQILGSGLLLAGILILITVQDWRVGGVMTVFAVIAAVAISRVTLIGGPRWTAERQARSEMAGFLEERLGGLDDISANAGGAHVMRRHAAISGSLNHAGRSAGRMGMAVNAAINALYALGLAIALIGGVILFRRHEITLGTVYLFVQYTGMMAMSLALIGMQLQQFQSAGAGLGRVCDLQVIASRIVDGPGLDLPRRPPSVVFRDVNFAYDAAAPVLRDICFDLAPGETLGLLGRTGSGKSTLIRLLFRLYEIGEGAILIDGQDIRRATLAQLRARVLEVLVDIGLGPWLERLPGGLDSDLTAGGLSAGEAQLLAFARVFLRDHGLVVLDEACSRLDPATDRLIERAMDKLLRPSPTAPRRTAIVIAHKLAMVLRADKILILDHGRVVEWGDRAALASDPASHFAGLLRSGVEGALQ